MIKIRDKSKLYNLGNCYINIGNKIHNVRSIHVNNAGIISTVWENLVTETYIVNEDQHLESIYLHTLFTKYKRRGIFRLINNGTISSTPKLPFCIYIDEFKSNSIIIVENNNNIIGHGGNGASRGYAGYVPSTNGGGCFNTNNRAVKIINTGTIASGGGGGGGISGLYNLSSWDHAGGGGGAGITAGAGATGGQNGTTTIGGSGGYAWRYGDGSKKLEIFGGKGGDLGKDGNAPSSNGWGNVALYRAPQGFKGKVYNTPELFSIENTGTIIGE